MSVEYELQGPVAIITINRPHCRNAVDRATAQGLASAWARFDADDRALVAVFTGSGGHFSAGADLKEFNLVDDPAGYLGFTRTEVGKPTIAAIEGFCVAGGLEMALWCDLRVAGESARFGCFERRFGVPLVDGGTQRLPLIIGRGRALDLILTGREVETSEALMVGLISRVVPDGEALASAVKLAQEISTHPQPTLRSDRAAVLAGVELQLEQERRLGNEAMAAAGAVRVETFRSGQGRHGEPA
jgi:enoyl-CoA hydratase